MVLTDLKTFSLIEEGCIWGLEVAGWGLKKWNRMRLLLDPMECGHSQALAGWKVSQVSLARPLW